MNVTQLPPMMCPSCATVVDAHGDFARHGQKVKGGDFTVCLTCAVILRFSDDVQTLRAATAEEVAEYPGELEEARRLVLRYREWCKTHPPPQGKAQ